MLNAMKNTSREALNERFVRVYRALEKRGEIINYHPDKNKSEFARKVLGNASYGHLIDKYLSPDDSRKFPYKYVDNLCKYYGISEDYMYKGKGMMFEADCFDEEGYLAPEGEETPTTGTFSTRLRGHWPIKVLMSITSLGKAFITSRYPMSRAQGT